MGLSKELRKALKYELMLNKNMSMVPCYNKAEADAVLAEKDKEIRRLNRLLWLARATAAKNAAGEVHNLIVCMRERHPKMTLSNTEAREREFLEKARRCRKKAKEYK